MGNHKFNLKYSIKGQVIFAVILILVCSLVSTVVTYIAVTGWIRPANASEMAVNALDRYIASHGAAILQPTEQPKLQSVVKGGGTKFLVMDLESRPIYGTLGKTPVMTRAEMYRSMNTTSVSHQRFEFGGTVKKVIPVLASDGSLVGAVYVQWALLPSGVQNANTWRLIVALILLAAPFVYMLLFTYLFARRVGKKINEPLQTLIQATSRIQQRDLDFSIDYRGKNEISQVLTAFEGMRKGLKESLLAQWKLEEERREMLAAISHDLRTPITIIQGHVEMLLEDASHNPDRLHRYLETIVRNTHRVVRLMNDFRTVTEIDSPGFSLKQTNVDVEEYIQSKYNEFLIVSHTNGVNLSLNYRDVRLNQSPMSIDTDRISQVIDNIMANALRFTPKNGHIWWKVLVEEKNLKVAIDDTGEGLPVPDPSRLFQKFYQADRSRSTENGHSGLGLYIVKSLVEKHGGSISAANNPYGGATFEFSITT